MHGTYHRRATITRACLSPGRPTWPVCWPPVARKALLRETRAALMKKLQVGSSEFLSIMRVVQGDLDVSVRRLLVSDIEHETKT